MKRFIAILLTVILLGSFSITPVASQPTAPAKSQSPSIQQVPSIAQVKPKKPVKIKLKRNSKDDYSWEISGENADDIINADKKLRKGLGLE